MTFMVTMRVADDDQTDAADMVDLLADVLNCKGGACADWQAGHRETVPESRPVFAVRGGWAGDGTLIVDHAEAPVGGDEVDIEACPGCGCVPGDGITEGCNYPDGCGYFPGSRHGDDAR